MHTLLDVLQAEIAKRDGVNDSSHSPKSASPHHSFFYQDRERNATSTRQDRWLTSDIATAWVRHVNVDVPAPPTDHCRVSLRLTAPRVLVRCKGYLKCYPTPGVATAAAQVQVTKLLLRQPNSLVAALQHSASGQRDPAAC